MGSSASKAALGATTNEPTAPEPKHLADLIRYINGTKMSVAHFTDILSQKTGSSSWVVVFKALVTVHHLMVHGNERFLQHLASRSSLFTLHNFLDKSVIEGYSMSTFIRRYSRYLNEKSLAYRMVAIDITKAKRGLNGMMRTLSTKDLMNILPVIQTQFDALLNFNANADELTNSIIEAAFMLLFKDSLRLFVAYNEGILNLLGKYFHMRKTQCRESLDIYIKFLRRTTKLAQFLKVAEEVGVNQNDIPHLTQVPHSLLEALQQHLASLEEKGDGYHPHSLQHVLMPSTIYPPLLKASASNTRFADLNIGESTIKKSHVKPHPSERAMVGGINWQVSTCTSTSDIWNSVSPLPVPHKVRTPMGDPLVMLRQHGNPMQPRLKTNNLFDSPTEYKVPTAMGDPLLMLQQLRNPMQPRFKNSNISDLPTDHKVPTSMGDPFLVLPPLADPMQYSLRTSDLTDLRTELKVPTSMGDPFLVLPPLADPMQPNLLTSDLTDLRTELKVPTSMGDPFLMLPPLADPMQYSSKSSSFSDPPTEFKVPSPMEDPLLMLQKLGNPMQRSFENCSLSDPPTEFKVPSSMDDPLFILQKLGNPMQSSSKSSSYSDPPTEFKVSSPMEDPLLMLQNFGNPMQLIFKTNSLFDPSTEHKVPTAMEDPFLMLPPLADPMEPSLMTSNLCDLPTKLQVPTSMGDPFLMLPPLADPMQSSFETSNFYYPSTDLKIPIPMGDPFVNVPQPTNPMQQRFKTSSLLDPPTEHETEFM